LGQISEDSFLLEQMSEDRFLLEQFQRTAFLWSSLLNTDFQWSRSSADSFPLEQLFGRQLSPRAAYQKTAFPYSKLSEECSTVL
jgi:hypothetical protein